MKVFKLPIKSKHVLLSLGAESAGNFSIFKNEKVFYFDNFGDLLEAEKFIIFKKEILSFLKKEKLRPSVIITDLHPDYVTTILGSEFSKKFKAKHIKVQHHHAHICSQLPLCKLQTVNCKLYGIALDGTGYGTDKKIWGGEVFKISNSSNYLIPNQIPNSKLQISNKFKIHRIGHLENQTLIGGDLAIREPTRVLISVLSKFLSKKKVYLQVKKHYSKNEFELLWNQMQDGFNCIETSSAGRILDAVSVLLGFSENERKEKHGATYLLEKNSTKPYRDLRPKLQISSHKSPSNSKIQNSKYILDTTHLFKYLLKYIPMNVHRNVHRDPRRLAATAQLYIAEGMHEIIKKHLRANEANKLKAKSYLSGGLSENTIIKKYFISQGLITSKEKSLIARGDKGISVGQIIYYLQNKK